MRFLTVYLVVYYALLFGAGFALWQSGSLQQVPASWQVIGALIAVGFGLMLAVVSSRAATAIRE